MRMIDFVFVTSSPSHVVLVVASKKRIMIMIKEFVETGSERIIKNKRRFNDVFFCKAKK